MVGNVLVITEHYPPQTGGSPAFSSSLVDNMRKLGARIEVLTYNWGKPNKETRVDPGLVLLNVPPLIRKERWFVLFAILPAIRAIRSAKPDVIHVSHGYFAMILA